MRPSWAATTMRVRGAHQVDELQRRSRCLARLRGAAAAAAGAGAAADCRARGTRRRRCRALRSGLGRDRCGAGRGARAGGGRRRRRRGRERAPRDLLAGDRQAPVGQPGERRDHGLRVARDQLGAQQHRVDVFLGVVVGEDRRVQVGRGAGGAQVAGGGEDRVDGVVGVGVAGVERVDAVLDPGGRHELHPADGAGRRDRLVGAVVGLDFVDRREDLPRHAVLDRRGLVDRQQEQRDAVEARAPASTRPSRPARRRALRPARRSTCGATATLLLAGTGARGVGVAVVGCVAVTFELAVLRGGRFLAALEHHGRTLRRRAWPAPGLRCPRPEARSAASWSPGSSSACSTARCGRARGRRRGRRRRRCACFVVSGRRSSSPAWSS